MPAPTAPPPKGVSRLTLRINGVDYVVLPMGISYGCRSYQLRKKGDGGASVATYTVQETNNGAKCNCPDFTSRRQGRDKDGCKHLRAMRTFYLVF